MLKIHLKKHQFLNNNRENTGWKLFNDPKAHIEYSNDIQYVYKNIEEYNIDKKIKILIVVGDMIADMINNKKINPVVTALFVKRRKLNISTVFIITQSYFKGLKDVRLNSTHFFIPNRTELQQIAFNHSLIIDFT